MDPAHAVDGERPDPPADRGRAGEAHHVDTGVGDQRLAGDGTRTRDDVDHATRHTGPVRGLGEHQRGERGDLGRLEHDGVARGDRRQHLPRGHLQRVVPRRDRADHADRLAPYVGRVVAGVLPRGLPLELARGAAEERGVVDGARHVELPGQPQRLAGLAALGDREVVGDRLQLAGEGEQRAGTLRRGRPRPVRVRRPRGRDRVVDVVGSREIGVDDGAPGGRVDHGTVLSERPDRRSPPMIWWPVVRHLQASSGTTGRWHGWSQSSLADTSDSVVTMLFRYGFLARTPCARAVRAVSIAP